MKQRANKPKKLRDRGEERALSTYARKHKVPFKYGREDDAKTNTAMSAAFLDAIARQEKLNGESTLTITKTAQ